MSNIVLAGYKFKPTHKDIHFIPVVETSGNYKYSTDIKAAKHFTSEGQATRAIYTELASFSMDDDYEWTPVLTDENGKEIGNIRPFFKVGSEQFKAQDLPHFLSIAD